MTFHFDMDQRMQCNNYIWLKHLSIYKYYEFANQLDDVHITNEDLYDMALIWKITIVVYSFSEVQISKNLL